MWSPQIVGLGIQKPAQAARRFGRRQQRGDEHSTTNPVTASTRERQGVHHPGVTHLEAGFVPL
jgi:hypothetical protein